MKKLLYTSFILSAIVYIAPSLFSAESPARPEGAEARPTVQYRETKSRTARSRRRQSQAKSRVVKQAETANIESESNDTTRDAKAGMEGPEVAVASPELVVKQ
ncbi:MAG TPA: hypothetical protein VJH03_08435 [Blastocatellia bacterium]|nr:hypothetical protein [Blastocatellia bacterium]